MNTDKPKSVDEYIAGFPDETKILLQQIRKAIKDAAPEVEEVISYQMPAYKYFGMLVYFAGYKNHIGFYPTASGIIAYKKQLSRYKGAKGSVQFPLEKPLPLKLISDIVRFRVNENLIKKQSKSK